MKNHVPMGILLGIQFGLIASAQAADLNMNLYSDVLASAGTDGTPPAFALGGVDFFTTSKVNDQINLVSENVLEILGEDGTVFDLERLYIDIGASPSFKLRLGREHMPVGYYAQNFHHAMLFQLTTSRPLILSFEDDGGVLPAHNIGAIAHGQLMRNSPVVLGYDFGISNGRGLFADDVMSTFDRNVAKSLSGRITLSPTGVTGMEIGVSGVYDVIPDGYTDDAGTLIVTEPLQETLGSAHFVLRNYPIDLIIEGYYVSHTGVNSGRNYTMYGGFAQFGYEINKVTPYTRFDMMTRDGADPFFTASGAPNDAMEIRVGGRYAATSNVSGKLEVAHDVQNSAQTATGQIAFGF